MVASFKVVPEQVEVAVIGMRIESEHEDSCCVTIELMGAAEEKRPEVEAGFLKLAKKAVSKGAKPDHVRFASLPRKYVPASRPPQMAYTRTRG